MNIKIILSAFLCIILASGCARKEDENIYPSKTIYAMDTVMEIKAYGKNAEKAIADAENIIKKLDADLDLGNKKSEIYKINHNAGTSVSEETGVLIRSALNICYMTDGAFDITIAPLMHLCGFYTKEYKIPQSSEISAALKKVGYKNISFTAENIFVKNGGELDHGGIAKGYLSSKIYDIFDENQVEGRLISLGGNIHTYGTKADGSSWKIAIQHPDKENFVGIVSANNLAVVTSGKYQRFFEKDGKRYHHIIDPATGYPSGNELESVTVVSRDATLADGLSTALLVMGVEKGSNFWKNHEGFEIVFVTKDGVHITEGLEDMYKSEYDFSVIRR